VLVGAASVEPVGAEFVVGDVAAQHVDAATRMECPTAVVAFPDPLSTFA
jgi:hypothetical protein